jgi:peptide/nickel transport system permease protein
MITYIVRRLILSVIVVLLVTIIIFLAMHFLPGDPILIHLSSSGELKNFSEEQVVLLRHEYGLDRSLLVQYTSWMWNILHGDMGKSIMYQAAVAKEVIRRVPINLYMGGLAFLIGFIIGIPAGIICAVRRGEWIDSLITVLTNIGITLPIFWLGILLAYVFGLKLHWLPVFGYTSPFDDFWQSTRQIIMPVACLALFPIASTARQTRSSMLEVMHQDYIRTAWSKGLRERSVIIRHALKNGLIPIVTFVGLGISGIIGGEVLIENVFAIPGMGRLLVSSIQSHDFVVVQGITLVIAVAIVFVNLIVDISYSWLDPRIRYQ